MIIPCLLAHNLLFAFFSQNIAYTSLFRAYNALRHQFPIVNSLPQTMPAVFPNLQGCLVLGFGPTVLALRLKTFPHQPLNVICCRNWLTSKLYPKRESERTNFQSPDTSLNWGSTVVIFRILGFEYSATFFRPTYTYEVLRIYVNSFIDQ